MGYWISALLAASAIADAIVKFTGAAYLVFLGLCAWLSARRGSTARTPQSRLPAAFPQVLSRGAALQPAEPQGRGVLPGSCRSFSPGRLALDPGLAVTAAATVMCWYVLVALIIAAVGRFLTTRVSRMIDAAAGTILGVLVAATGWRPWLPRWRFRQ